MNVLIVTGASGGHLYPALALAEALKLRNPGVNIAFVCPKHSGLNEKIARQGYKIFEISIIRMRFGFIGFLKGIYGLVKSFAEVFLIIDKARPDAVVGFGSYASLPAMLEAAFFKKPTIIHEQNVSLGLANRMLAFFVDKVAVSFNETVLPRLCGGKKFFTGNPLGQRAGKVEKNKARGFFSLEDKFTILVLGGSLGAHNINFAFTQAVNVLSKEEDFQFIHITGKNDYQAIKEAYSRIKLTNRVFSFLDEMSYAYCAADMVICRAGAGTISELAYFAMPAILIPYPLARNHQSENARVLSNQKAAVVIEESGLTVDLLCEHIIGLIRSEDNRRRQSENIKNFAQPAAAEKLAQLVERAA